jgi:maltose O-acetyltransferase
VNRIVDRLALAIDELLSKIKARAMRHRLTKYPHIHDSVQMGSNVQLIGPPHSFVIGKGTYINDVILVVSEQAKVTIGTHCAIGYRVSIKAVTHAVSNPCQNDQGEISIIQKDITIGNSCWIGDNVFIREGVSLGNNVVVGANSVVTKSAPNNTVIAGVPAKVIRMNAKPL